MHVSFLVTIGHIDPRYKSCEGAKRFRSIPNLGGPFTILRLASDRAERYSSVQGSGVAGDGTARVRSSCCQVPPNNSTLATPKYSHGDSGNSKRTEGLPNRRWCAYLYSEHNR